MDHSEFSNTSELNKTEISDTAPVEGHTPMGSSTSPTIDLEEGHESKSLLDMWSGLHTDQISLNDGHGFCTGGEEMLVVRNTFLELCKLAEKQGPYNPDRFVSAPAAYSFPSSESLSSPKTTTESSTPENAYNFPPSTPVSLTTASSGMSTLMMRNIPTRISSTKLIETVLSTTSTNITSLIDFLYLPIDFKTNKNLGYCFINFKSDELAKQFMIKYNGRKYVFCDTSEKMLQITLSNRQGYYKNLEVFTQTKLLDTWPPNYRPLAEYEGDLVPIDSTLLQTILEHFVSVD